MNSVLERRFIPAHLRALAPVHYSSSPGTLRATFASYHALSSDLGGFKERIADGAFRKSLDSGDDCVALINHDQNLICGRRRTGTLRLSSDARGLHGECDLPDTSYARDLWALCNRADISECSFAFRCDEDSWDEEDDPDDRSRRIPVRTVKSAKIFDVSYVTSPAYVGSTSITPVGDAAGPVRAHSFEQLFPAGVLPAEIRARVPDVRERLELRRDSRRRLTNSVLSI